MNYPKLFLSVLINVFILSINTAYSQNLKQRDTIEILKKTPGADITIYDLYHKYKNSDPDESIKYAFLFLDNIDSKHLNNYIIAGVYNYVSNYYANVKIFLPKSEEYLVKARNIYLEVDDKEMLAYTDFRLAYVTFKIGKYFDTYKHINSSLEYFEREKNKDMVAACYNILGILHYTIGDKESAKEIFSKIYLDLGQDSTSLFAIHNIAVNEFNSDSTSTSNALLNECMRVLELNEDPENFTYFINSANILNRGGRLEDSKAAFEKAQRMIYKEEDQATYNYYFGDYCYNVKDLDMAEKLYFDAYTFYKRAGYLESQANTLRKLIHLYEDIGMDEKEYQALKEYYDFIDSQNNNSTSNNDKLLLQKEILNNDRIYKQELYEKEMHFKLFIAANTILLIFIIIVVIYYRKNNRFKRKELEMRYEHLKYESMEADLRAKNDIVELNTLQKMERDSFIKNIIRELNEIKESLKYDQKPHIQMIIDKLSSDNKIMHWKEQVQYLSGQDSTFYHNLVAEFDDLTPNERKLCLLLHKNMSSKEISALMGLSVQSVTVARGRLRKKLGLTGKDESLISFLSRYESK